MARQPCSLVSIVKGFQPRCVGQAHSCLYNELSRKKLELANLQAQVTRARLSWFLTVRVTLATPSGCNVQKWPLAGSMETALQVLLPRVIS